MLKRLLTVAILLLTLLTASHLCHGRTSLNVIKSLGNGVERVVSVEQDSSLRALHALDSATSAKTLRFLKNDVEILSMPLDSVARICKCEDVARIYINTDSLIDDLTEKELYLDATLSMSEAMGYDSIAPVKVNIKGRGNTTWDMPKKPYRLKFDKKISLGGMRKAKSYVLLANYIDPTLIHNALAFKTAQVLGLPYTNSICPVEVWLNGKYKGAYLLTEKVGLNAGSIHDVPEKSGVLYELSNEFDEQWRFRSPIDSLPVMIKDPDLSELALADSTFSAQSEFEKWRLDFEKFEFATAYPDDSQDLDGRYHGDRPENYVDMDELARWTMVYLVTGCGELNHPKSVFVHRASHTDKFHFGPVWDFDWLVDYYGNEQNQWIFDYYLIESWRNTNVFFKRLFKRESFRRALDNVCLQFAENLWPQVLDYIENYADMIEASALRNGELYPLSDPNRYPAMKCSTETFRTNVNRFLDWVYKRMEFVLFAPNHGVIEDD